MQLKNGGNGAKKGLGQALKAMGGLQKAAIAVAAVVVVGGITAAAVAVINSKPAPVVVPSVAPISSAKPSSVKPSSIVESSSSEVSSETSSKASSEAVSSKAPPASSQKPKASSVKPSDKPADKPASSAAPAASSVPDPKAVAGLPEGYQAKYADLYKQNNEFVGWITYTGKLDYAVAQHNDNTYYLNKDFNKKQSVWGNPYMDPRVSMASSTNYLIFSHSNPKTGAMFQSLKGMRKVDYYKQHPTITFNSVYEDATYKVVAFFVENTKPGTEFFHYNDFIDQTDDAFINDYIAKARERSFINTTVDIQPGDKFLTLSTCWDTNPANWDRLVTVARKVRPDESTAVDTAGASQNTAQKLPPGGLFSKVY